MGVNRQDECQTSGDTAKRTENHMLLTSTLFLTPFRWMKDPNPAGALKDTVAKTHHRTLEQCVEQAEIQNKKEDDALCDRNRVTIPPFCCTLLILQRSKSQSKTTTMKFFSFALIASSVLGFAASFTPPSSLRNSNVASSATRVYGFGKYRVVVSQVNR